ncbi:MAG: biopolymer transporter ExbD [Schleiferiaceae bacterium]|jgi:biopolymer transport protein ExbD|nr:biopolymer transporter ExbD [Schleiferiaceae bacterium]MDR9442633.1 biopolymer transporter ExbD [Schleiferiaceae bacterium]
MAKFKKKTGGGAPGISTASLPDIVFMLLFFFMVTTVMREVTLKVENKKPKATEIKKLERKSLVTYIYVGKPKAQYIAQVGSEPRIQLNDAFARVKDVQNHVITAREEINEAERPLMTVSIKADSEVKMGLISDIKQELRKANTLKLNYSTRKGEVYGDKG